MPRIARLLAALIALAPAAGGAQVVSGGPPGLTPTFSIWDVALGAPVAGIDPRSVGEIACGTDGGPRGMALKSFADWADCPAEAGTGLHEVYFSYDDEQDYIAKALELEYKYLQGGTSVFAHPVIVSILVDDAGISRGLRIITDDRAPATVRRNAVTLSRNFEARYEDWGMECHDIPPADGEQPVGNRFIHHLCAGTDPDGSGTTVRIESSYLRKRGQEAISRETQTLNPGYFESRTRFELLTGAAR